MIPFQPTPIKRLKLLQTASDRCGHAIVDIVVEVASAGFCGATLSWLTAVDHPFHFPPNWDTLVSKDPDPEQLLRTINDKLLDKMQKAGADKFAGGALFGSREFLRGYLLNPSALP